MASISGRIPQDYTDIVAGISALVASGVASGEITEFYLYTDTTYSTGVFSATIPNSGTFYVIGSGTPFVPQETCYINTESPGSFNFVDCQIIGEDTFNWLFNISGSTVIFDRSSILAPASGILSTSGTLALINSYAAGSGIGVFYSGQNFQSQSSEISDFSKGVYADNISLIDTVFTECDTAADLPLSGQIIVDHSLLQSGTYAILKGSGSISTVTNSTLDTATPIFGSGGLVYVDKSILHSNNRCVKGFLVSGSVFSDVGLYPSGWWVSEVVNVPSGSNISYAEPRFNNRGIGDHRLKFDYVDGSPYVEHTDLGVVSGVNLRAEIPNVILSDYKGTLSDTDFRQFIYKQGKTLAMTDYNKEVEYAHFINSHADIEYFTTTQANFSVYEQSVKSCFSKDGTHPQPFDWDLVNLESVEITDSETDLQYVVPRSYIDLEPIVETKLSFLGAASFRFDKMTKANIKVYNKESPRGISYDYDLSDPGRPYAWAIEGRNQLLRQQNIFTGENIHVYPLSCPDLSLNNMILVSGIVFVGKRDDKYRFVDTNNPNNEYIAETEDGHFKWIDTSMNQQFDARGVLAYKNNIYITGTRYSEDIYDRTTVPTVDGNGLLLRYYNSNKYSHYITSLDSMPSNRLMVLASGNAFPTDISVYEDGNLFVGDYAIKNGLYRYKFAYDYALVDEQYDRLSRVLLRESYPSVDF